MTFAACVTVTHNKVCEVLDSSHDCRRGDLFLALAFLPAALSGVLLWDLLRAESGGPAQLFLHHDMGSLLQAHG